MNISAMSGVAASGQSSSTATSGDFNQIVTDWLLSERLTLSLAELKQEIKKIVPRQQPYRHPMGGHLRPALRQGIDGGLAGIGGTDLFEKTLNPLVIQSLGLSYAFNDFMQAMICGNEDDAPEPFF